MIIYKITNIYNGRVYVGQTVCTLAKRWNEHATSKKNSALYNAFRKYGRENMKIEVVCSAIDPCYLNELEQHFIKYYNSLSPHGYNHTSGGDSAYARSEESKQKQRAAMTGRVHSEEARKKISESLIGKPSPRKGVKLSDETKAKISAVQIGRKASEETKKKQSISHVGAKAYNSRKVQCIETGAIYGSTGEASRETNIQQTSISAVCLGNRKTAGGFTFKYV